MYKTTYDPNKKTYKCEQVVEAAGIWAVFVDGAGFNLKSQHYLDSEERVYGSILLN